MGLDNISQIRRNITAIWKRFCKIEERLDNLVLTPVSESHTDVFINTNTLPAAITPAVGFTCATYVFVDVDNMTADLDLTGWSPTGLCDYARVRVRKIDASAFRILFNGDLLAYAFVDQQSEYIELIWDGAQFRV